MSNEGFPVESVEIKTEREKVRDSCEKNFEEICTGIERISSEQVGIVDTTPVKDFEDKFGEAVRGFLRQDFDRASEAGDKASEVAKEIRKPFYQMRQNWEESRKIRNLRSESVGELDAKSDEISKLARKEDKQLEDLDLAAVNIVRRVLQPYVEAHRK